MTDQQVFEYLKGLIDGQQRQINILTKMIRELKPTGKTVTADYDKAKPKIQRMIVEARENLVKNCIAELMTYTAGHDRPMRDEAIAILNAELERKLG